MPDPEPQQQQYAPEDLRAQLAHHETFFQLLGQLLSKYNRTRPRNLDTSIAPPPTLKPRMDLLDDPASPNIVALLELPGISRQEIQLRIGQDGNLLVYGQRLASPFLRTAKGSAVPLNPVHSAKNGSASRTSSTHNLTIDTSSPSFTNVSSSANLFGPDHASHFKVQEIKYGQYQRSIPLPLGTQSSDIEASIKDGLLRLEWPRIPPNSPPASGRPSEPSSSAPAPRDFSHRDTHATPQSYTYPSPASQSAPSLQIMSAAPAPTPQHSDNHAPPPLPQSHYIVPSQTLASSSTAAHVRSRTAPVKRFVTPLTTTRPPRGMRISVNSLLLGDDDIDMDEDGNDELEPSST